METALYVTMIAAAGVAVLMAALMSITTFLVLVVVLRDLIGRRRR